MVISTTSSRQHTVPPLSLQNRTQTFAKNLSNQGFINMFSAVPILSAKSRFSWVQIDRNRFKHFTSCLSNRKLLHHDAPTSLVAPSWEVFLQRPWTYLLLSIMIASITSCGVVSPLQARFPVIWAKPDLRRRNMIARVTLYFPLPQRKHAHECRLPRRSMCLTVRCVQLACSVSVKLVHWLNFVSTHEDRGHVINTLYCILYAHV